MLIFFRRDIIENWLKVDPILSNKELALILPEGQFKIGDGLHRFSELPISTTLPEFITMANYAHAIEAEVLRRRAWNEL